MLVKLLAIDGGIIIKRVIIIGRENKARFK